MPTKRSALKGSSKRPHGRPLAAMGGLWQQQKTPMAEAPPQINFKVATVAAYPTDSTVAAPTEATACQQGDGSLCIT